MTVARVVAECGAPAFRAKQLWHWLYYRGVSDFERMRTLPKALRAALAARYRQVPVLLDGYVATAAAALICRQRGATTKPQGSSRRCAASSSASESTSATAPSATMTPWSMMMARSHSWAA